MALEAALRAAVQGTRKGTCKEVYFSLSPSLLPLDANVTPDTARAPCRVSVCKRERTQRTATPATANTLGTSGTRCIGTEG